MAIIVTYKIEMDRFVVHPEGYIDSDWSGEIECEAGDLPVDETIKIISVKSEKSS